MDSGKISKDNKQELKESEQRVDLINLKNDYFLKKLFENIPKNTSFKIFKYNKKIQKRLNISIKDYKEYTEYLQIYSPIEIDVVLIKHYIKIIK